MTQQTTVIETQAQCLMYPPRTQLGTLRTITYPLARGNELEMFCATVKGERVLLPDWGLPDIVFKSNLTDGEIEAIIRVNVEQYFPDTEFIINCESDVKDQSIKIVKIRYEDVGGFGTITVRV